MNALLDEPEIGDRGIAAPAEPRVERRRPGRMASVSPELIPLLRGHAEPEPNVRDHPADDLAPATGIAVGSLISSLLWGLIIVAVWTVRI